MNILGISAFYHDSAATLVRNGEIIAAAQEERFTRKKHDYNFPLNAVNYCLEAGGLHRNEQNPTDTTSLADGFITITALAPGMTNHEKTSQLKQIKW